jgi:hypothetical protein
MSTRGVEKLRALCNLLIRQNRDGGLHSPMLNRAVAVRAAQDILALTRLRPSRPWADSDALDVLVSELRRTASERRLTAEIRTLALKRLSWIELGEPALGDEPTDELIRKLVTTGATGSQPKSEQSLPANETFEQRKARILAAQGG